jgi:hypothetical protein
MTQLEPALPLTANAVPAAAAPYPEWSPQIAGVVDPVRERAARRTLRGQIARLERELCDALAASFPHPDVDLSGVRSSGGPRLLSLGELERARDALAERVGRARRAVSERAEAQEANRVLLERLRRDPGRYRFVRLANADVGGGGCGVWQVRPRLGLIGMLAGWWQVKLSSGCPLAGGPGARPAPIGLVS